MSIDLEEVFRRVGPQLLEQARRVIAEHPGAHPVGLVFDAQTGVARGLLTDAEAAEAAAGTAFARIVPRDVARRACDDQPQVKEWFGPADETPRELLIIVRTPDECVVGSAPLTIDADPGADAQSPPDRIDPWQQLSESEQSYSMIEKHRERLATMARAHCARHPDARVVGLVIAPELDVRVTGRSDPDDPAPVHVEDTGERVMLSTWESASEMLREHAPNVLAQLAIRVPPGREREVLAVVAATEHGFSGALFPLAATE